MNPVYFHECRGDSIVSPAALPPNPPLSTPFWQRRNLSDKFKKLRRTLGLAKSLKKELELLLDVKDKGGVTQNAEKYSDGYRIHWLSNYIKNKNTDLSVQETVTIRTAASLISDLRQQLEPLQSLENEAISSKEQSLATRLSKKMLKYKRNRRWRKRKRKRMAESHIKAHEEFDKAREVVDEWFSKEVAKNDASRKVERMKEIGKEKAKEEKKKADYESEMILVVEKLQELRSIRLQKLKKQGRFFPEEDNRFLEKVRAAVEEEERQVLAATETNATKDAIATAEESRNAIHNDEKRNSETQKPGDRGKETCAREISSHGQQCDGVYDCVGNLPPEFYHYYHGSHYDLGTLIEVRRTWDSYIRPGGSRIPGHWVQPPPPSDEIWASYLVNPC